MRCLHKLNIDTTIKISPDYISYKYFDRKSTYLTATYSYTYHGDSFQWHINKDFSKPYLDRIPFVVTSICLEITNKRHHCTPSNHLFRSYIFYKEYLSYIVHLRGSIGPSMVNFEQNSTVFYRHWRKFPPWHTRWFILMCLFCFKLRTRRSFVLLGLLVCRRERIFPLLITRSYSAAYNTIRIKFLWSIINI